MLLKRLLPSSIQSVLRFFLPAREPCIQRLPDEVLVDLIFSYLDVEDILHLRQVCKWLYDLTHQAVVWKRVLKRISTRIPTPPTPRYAFEHLTAANAESLVVQALSLESNWHRDVPDLQTRSFRFQHNVAEMVVLPGGHYLVASVSDPKRTQWDVMVCALDPRYGVVPIAKSPTKTKAYNLQARYSTVNGVSGITIAYVRRDWVHRQDGRRGINVSDYSGTHEIDPPYPLKHECLVLHAALSSIEAIYDPSVNQDSEKLAKKLQGVPAPFEQICLVRSRSQRLGPLVLDDLAGEPYLSLVKQPDNIILKPLNGGPASTLHLLPHPAHADLNSRVAAIRPLPDQDQLLVVRCFHHENHPTLALEIHDIPTETPQPTTIDSAPLHFFPISQRLWDSILITERCTSDPYQTPSEGKSHDNISSSNEMSILVSVNEPKPGLECITIPFRGTESSSPPSESLQSPSPHYQYIVSHARREPFMAASPHTQFALMPGTKRRLALTTRKKDSADNPYIIGMYRMHTRARPRAQRTSTSNNLIKIPCNLDDDSAISALTWDETTGRALFAKSGVLQIVDFAHTPKADVLQRCTPPPQPIHPDPTEQYNASFDVACGGLPKVIT
ncbi:hypothetical protein BDW22DRAFT_1360487 [Trametopsis cervina]|nr:hypothetical protein BDW22DRAFT_1360487 [Trametopsis cervina]